MGIFNLIDFVELNRDDEQYENLSKILLSYIVNGVKVGVIDKYSANVQARSITDYGVWSYLEKTIPITYGIETPDVAVLSITPKVRDIYGLPPSAEAMYIPDIKAIVVQNKNCNENIFNSIVVHEYTHYIQDILGLFSHSIYSILCPQCNSTNVLIQELGRNILGIDNNIGCNVRAAGSDEKERFLNDSSNKISDYMFIDNGLVWMENAGWQAEGIPAVGYRLYKEFYYNDKFSKLSADFTRMDQDKFLIEIYVTPQRKIDSYKFSKAVQGSTFYQPIVLDEQGSNIYEKLIYESFKEELTEDEIRQLFRAIQVCVLNKGFDVKKTHAVYRKNFSQDAVNLEHVEKAIELLGYKIPNKYSCISCGHFFEIIPLSNEDAQDIIGIVRRLHYEEGLSAEAISVSLGGNIPSSLFQRTIDVIEFNQVDYFERPAEIMAFSEQYRYLVNLKDKNGNRKYSNEDIFNAYRTYFISATPEKFLPKEVKEAMLIIGDIDFSYMYWKDYVAYECEDLQQKKEKNQNIMKQYKDYYKNENKIISNKKNKRCEEALRYLENLYSFIINSELLFYS